MRIDLKQQLKKIDRNAVLIVVALIAGIGISAWLIKDVSARQKAVDKLAADVDADKRQVDSLPPQTAQPLTPEQLSEKIGPFFLAGGTEEVLRADLANLAAEYHLSGVNINLDAKNVNDPQAPPDAEDSILASLGITKKVEVSISFQAEYQDSAKFLEALKQQLHQKVLIRGANLVRGEFPRMGTKVSGSVTLRLYQKDS
jgi:hypothetical protein